jgi:Rrf2 family protein
MPFLHDYLFFYFMLILDKNSKPFYSISMLRLSTKGQYGVRAMFELARNYNKGPLSIKEISKRQDVSVAYLEQLLNKLRKSHLIKSRKGPGGGYEINKRPEEISIGLILNALEGPVTITQCLGPKAKECNRVEGCVARMLWKSLGEKIEHFLGTISLDDLIREEVNQAGSSSNFRREDLNSALMQKGLLSSTSLKAAKPSSRAKIMG